MLEGKEIILRPLKVTDWQKTIEWRNNFSIKKMALMHPFPITEIIEKKWYQTVLKSTDNKNIYFTIVKKNDIPVGFITLKNINYTHKNCSLGIVIGDTDDRGKGYGKEAMLLLITYAFNTLNLKKITVEVVESNKRAYALYKKLGFIEEGRLKQHYFIEGEYLDVHLMSIFR